MVLSLFTVSARDNRSKAKKDQNSTPVGTAPSNTHLDALHALLRTPPVATVERLATGRTSVEDPRERSLPHRTSATDERDAKPRSTNLELRTTPTVTR